MASLKRPGTWKGTLLALIILEFVISTAMLLIGYLTGNRYFRGVGVGLLIAWVTSAIAYFSIRHRYPNLD